ncbi:hypothetical protein L249_0434 [Ophiocordyceps polyrhachis-furcata BCC 54312]|uniref:Mediator of RNA polymerase II transcription subunit 21 n=1 Tax=Ophiocordyceps polyrhachis-furcata BCC 54312 TaxID=1330021 RepID=A0A367LDG1_9HYPO|nr:hypothetical protein L249_0434 [Ophiocordyceps polyrhachis-furcata BCC 54312]
MGGRLTQLQDTIDHSSFVHRRHDLETLGLNDEIRDIKQEPHQKEVDPLPADEFQAGLKELSRDLIVKEKEIEYIISSLPGLGNSEKDQEQDIKDLEEHRKIAEALRQEALREKDETLAQLDTIIRSILAGAKGTPDHTHTHAHKAPDRRVGRNVIPTVRNDATVKNVTTAIRTKA